MPSRFAFALLGAMAVSAGLAREGRAVVFSACTAADIIRQDSNCPNSTAPCSITKKFAIGNGCVLDFAARAVTITASGELDILSGNVTLKGGSLTLGPGSLIDGRGDQAPPGDRGGMMMIQVSGAVALQKGGAGNGVIDVSANAQSGTIVIQAGGSVTLDGKLLALNLTTSGAGGTITVRAGGDFI